MSLNLLQVEFTKTMAYFQVWCVEHGYDIIEAEAFRTKEQAQIYKEQGKGVLNSVHCKKLARDMLLYKDRTISYKIEDYRAMGEKWKRMHPLARWGGDFKKRNKKSVGRDPYHFSFEYRGVQ